MKPTRLDADNPTIDAVAVEHFAGGREAWPVPRQSSDAGSLGARLSELLAQESPDELLGRLGEFKRSVEDALRRASTDFRILDQLEESGLKNCARCSQELEARLAGNPHYLVIAKISEAEKLLSELTTIDL